MTETYIHDEDIHNLIDPEIIIPEILDLIKPKSIIDIGCGIGTFIKICKQKGVEKVMGVDGSWVNRKLLFKNVNIDEFVEVNLIEGFQTNSRFDLAICLEVAEHLPESYSDSFIKNLVDCSDVILFSAAIPGQTGQNHINEQWPDYWKKKFEYQDYSFHDVIRPLFWDNEKLSLWYKQNMFLALNNRNEDIDIVNNFIHHRSKKIINIVHPQYFLGRVAEVERLEKTINDYQNRFEKLVKGKASLFLYIKMIIKYFLRKIKVYNK